MVNARRQYRMNSLWDDQPRLLLTLFHDGVREFLEKERIALSLREHVLLDLRCQRGRVQHTIDHRSARLVSKRLEDNLRHIRPVEPGRTISWMVGSQEQERHTSQAGDQRGQERLRGRVDPLEIFNSQSERRLLTTLEEQVPEGLKGPCLAHGSAERGEGCRMDGDTKQVQERGETVLSVQSCLL